MSCTNGGTAATSSAEPPLGTVGKSSSVVISPEDEEGTGSGGPGGAGDVATGQGQREISVDSINAGSVTINSNDVTFTGTLNLDLPTTPKDEAPPNLKGEEGGNRGDGIETFG